jgi:hypothetical protein
MTDTPLGLSADELAAEGVTALPNKEVMSLLDLNADLDLGLDVAAPIDLAVAANLNVAAPIDAAAAANVLSFDSSAAALSDQQVLIDQTQSGDAVANAPQTSTLDQSNDTIEEPVTAPTESGAVVGDALSGDLLDVNLDVALDADVAAPIAGAVAANANIAAPIDAAVAANVGSIGSEATAVSQQTAIINQDLEGVTADATADQDSTIVQ